VRHLTKQNIDLNVAAQAGLVIRNERGGYYDRFRHRMIFPILDIQERVIAFGGRAMGDDQPKYLNSPETPLFSKTRSLYGLNFARKNIGDKGCAIVMEGYTDVITAHQAGYTNCVATLGTAMTVEHIEVLSRYTSKVVLAYDADSAGMTAALRGAALFNETDCDVRIARLPGGDDPDSLIRKGRVSEFDAAVSQALPIVDYKLAVLIERYDLSDPAMRAAMLNEAVRILAEVPASIERERHIRTLARYHPNFESGTTRAEDHIRRDVDMLIRRRSGAGRRNTPSGLPAPKIALEKAEAAILCTVIRGEEFTEMILESLDPEEFSSDTSRKAAHIVFEMFKEKRGIYLPDLLEKVDKPVSKFLSELLVSDEGPPPTEKALQDYITLIKNSKLRRLRTSDVLAPYIKNGTIDPSRLPSDHTMEEYEVFLKKSGKRAETDNQ
jgi:DNA primase